MPSTFYNLDEEMWPDLKQGQVVLMPVRVGVNRRTGKMIAGWPHVYQSMQVLFVTRFHTRVLRRWCGSFVPHLLGDTVATRMIARFYWAIATALDLWEPNYRLQRVYVQPTTANAAIVNTPEELRLGHMIVQHDGVYRPRAHLGDLTPEARRSFVMGGSGSSMWG